MFDHTNRDEALSDPEIAWEPDPDLLRDFLLERKLDREIERHAKRQADGGAGFRAGGTGPDTTIIPLAERAQEVIEITELEPADGTFIGKQINVDGSITRYPKV